MICLRRKRKGPCWSLDDVCREPYQTFQVMENGNLGFVSKGKLISSTGAGIFTRTDQMIDIFNKACLQPTYNMEISPEI